MEKTYDLIIIGSGPAGLSAAIYARERDWILWFWKRNISVEDR